MSEEVMYVYFNKDTGNITSVSNEVTEDSSYVTVPLADVMSILEGKEPASNYIVQYNPKTKVLEFVSRFEYVLDSYSVNDFIFELPVTETQDPDITLIQDIPNTCWKVQIGKELKSNLRSKGVSLNASMMFSVTAKDDPNILYKTLFVDFGKMVNDSYYVIPFSMPFETTDESLSVYTSRRFDTYQYKRIYE